MAEKQLLASLSGRKLLTSHQGTRLKPGTSFQRAKAKCCQTIALSALLAGRPISHDPAHCHGQLVGLDLQGLFQPEQFYDSMILKHDAATLWACTQIKQSWEHLPHHQPIPRPPDWLSKAVDDMKAEGWWHTEQVAQGGCGCLIPEGIQARLDVALGSLVCWLATLHIARGWNWWSLWSFSTQAILWFYDSSQPC